jgi:hypothetical protein
MRDGPFLAGMKGQRDGKILLGDNQAAGRSCCGRLCLSEVEFGLRFDSLGYIHTVGPRFTNLIRSWRPFVNRNQAGMCPEPKLTSN